MSENKETIETSDEPPENKSHEMTVIYFDWDDSLCPTSFLNSQNNNKLNNYEQELNELSDIIIKLFSNIIKMSTSDHPISLSIVTNAEEGWVEMSSQKYMPKLYTYLMFNNNNIDIISARTQYSSLLNQEPFLWKYYAFVSILNSVCQFNSIFNKKFNIISIGDSSAERNALKKLQENFINSTCKSIKLADSQELNMAISQLKLLLSYWDNLHKYDNHLDLVISITKHDQDRNKDKNINKNNKNILVTA
jgi:hypothetical protein